MHGIIGLYRHIGRTGLGWIDEQKSPVFRRGKSGNPTSGSIRADSWPGIGASLTVTVSRRCREARSCVLAKSHIITLGHTLFDLMKEIEKIQTMAKKLIIKLKNKP